MSISNLFLSGPEDHASARIRQLYQYLELYSAGELPRHTLFVLGKPPLATVSAEPDQLLLIDPPADATQRFQLEGNVAALFTGPPQDVGIPQIQTQPGGVAHLRIGDHLLDVYSQQATNVVHFPALGLICGGEYGSDVLLPRVASGSDGSEELETLLLLAKLLRSHTLQLYIPTAGTISTDRVAVTERLAGDVAYLNGLRRVAPGLATREDDPAMAAAAESLLPDGRRSEQARAVHRHNLRTLRATSSG